MVSLSNHEACERSVCHALLVRQAHHEGYCQRSLLMPSPNPRHPNFPIPGGPELRAKGWRQEGILRLLENVLAVGENPNELIVYAALGKAARSWAAHKAI